MITVNVPEVNATFGKEISSQFMQEEKKNTEPILLQTFKSKADETGQWLKDRLTNVQNVENNFLLLHTSVALKKNRQLTLAANDL